MSIRTLIDSSIPQKTVYLTNKDKLLMTPLTKLLINQKWNAFRSKDWDLYMHLKVKVREEVKKAKLLWTRKMKHSSPNGLWNVVGQLSGKKQKHCLQNLLTDFTSPKNLAEAIADTMKLSEPSDYTLVHVFLLFRIAKVGKSQYPKVRFKNV